MRAGRSTHIRGRAESVAAALRTGNIQIEPGKTQLLETRRSVVRGWLTLTETLRADGRDALADDVGRFLKAMPPPQTEREWFAHALLDRAREARHRIPEPMAR